MFVILSHQRAGSNLLRTLLDSHPDLTCYGEGWSDHTPHPIPEPEQVNWQKNEGFMVKYDKIINHPERVAFLRKAKIIHIKRRNLENQAASYGAMRQLKLPGFLVEKPNASPVEVRLKHIHGKRGIKRILKFQRAIEEMNFKNLIEVYYEDITHDKNITLLPAIKAKPILDFLEVPSQDLKTTITKTQLYEIGVGKGKR